MNDEEDAYAISSVGMSSFRPQPYRVERHHLSRGNVLKHSNYLICLGFSTGVPLIALGILSNRITILGHFEAMPRDPSLIERPYRSHTDMSHQTTSHPKYGIPFHCLGRAA